MVTTKGSRSQLNDEGAVLLGTYMQNCSAPLSRSQEAVPRDGGAVTVIKGQMTVPPSSLWRTCAGPATEQWRGIRPVRDLGSGRRAAAPSSLVILPQWSLAAQQGSCRDFPRIFLWVWFFSGVGNLSQYCVSSN